MTKISESYGNQEGNIQDKYEIERSSSLSVNSNVYTPDNFSINEYDNPDNTDYLVAVSCGILTGVLDIFWVGEFSLSNAQEWGRSKTEAFVIKVARIRGCKKDDLEGAIRFLENDAPMATDKLYNEWGGGYYHHLRDFSHHASIVGLVFSLITQFTGISYGTNKEGRFDSHKLPNDALIGKSFEEKIYLGVVMWALHLVSDMAGSSCNPGKGTGIPGPIISLLKGLSVLPYIRNISFNYNDQKINGSAMLSKVFNGTAFEHTSSKDLIHFDLRTELGIYAFVGKQIVPTVINRCMIRAFYFVRRFIWEIDRVAIKSIVDIIKVCPTHFLPVKNKCIIRMDTISSGVFAAIDAAHASISTVISKPSSKGELATRILFKTNFINIFNFGIAIKNDIKMTWKNKTPSINNVAISSDEEYLNADIPCNIEIDVSVEIDNHDLYNNAFDRMYSIVKKEKEERTSTSNKNMRSIFQLEDEETINYYNIVQNSKYSFIFENADLIMKLFKLYGIEYEQTESRNNFTDRPFIRTENGQRKLYIFSNGYIPHDLLKKNEKDFKDFLNHYRIDKITIVYLSVFFDGFNVQNYIANKIPYLSPCRNYIEIISIKELFSLISENEYFIYMSYVEKLNSDIRKLIGYRTIIEPSDSSLLELKNDIEILFRSYPIVDILKDRIYKTQIDIITKQFLDNGRYRAMLGNSSFAESFISSEWYFNTHKTSIGLEQTAIIAGYLKSVEQLLYSIIRFSIDTGKTIKKIGCDKNVYIDYTTENEVIADTSLGSLIGYCRHYSDLWSVNNYVKNYITNKLSEYRDKYRNDHLHKDNIFSLKEIECIRNNTIELIYLLLGAMKISDSDFALLDYEEEIPIEENQYDRFEEWLNRILSSENLIPLSSDICFYITQKGNTYTGQIEIVTLEGFDDYDIPKFNHPYYNYICEFKDCFEWEFAGDTIIHYDMIEEILEKQAMDMIKNYLENGKLSNRLKSYSNIHYFLKSLKKIYSTENK